MKKSSFWTDDYVPGEEEKIRDGVWKFFWAVFLGLIFIGVPSSRLWIGSWLLLGVAEIGWRIYLSGLRLKISDWPPFIRREIIAGFKSGWVITGILLFWPIDFLITMCFYLFGSRDFSYSSDYYHEQFAIYASGKGRYYGMHVQTACEFAEADVKMAQQTGDQIYEAVKQASVEVKRKSRFAFALSAVLGFLSAPLTFAQNKEKKKEEEKTIYGWSIFDLNIHPKSPLVLVGLDGKKSKIHYLSEAIFTPSPVLSRAFLEYKVTPFLRARIGRQFTPTIWFLPAPPNLPTVHDPVIINEMSITSPGFTLEYNDSRKFSVETMFTHEDKRPRFIARVAKTFGSLNLQFAFDKFRQRNRLGAQMVIKNHIFETEMGGFFSKKGPTVYIQGIGKPLDFFEGVIRYENSPWLNLKRRVVLGCSLFLEGIRVRISWASGGKLAAQATYSF